MKHDRKVVIKNEATKFGGIFLEKTLHIGAIAVELSCLGGKK